MADPASGLLNHTHDSGRRSWVASAHADGGDFPIQNLPFAVFRRVGSNEAFRGGVAIGDQVIDLAALSAAGALTGAAALAAAACRQPALNDFSRSARRRGRHCATACSRCSRRTRRRPSRRP
jgi:hypothetical protein